MKGKLGSAALPADEYITVYEVPEEKAASLNILAVNRGEESALFYVAIGTTATPAADDFVEHGAPLPRHGGIFERTGIVASAGEKVIVRATTADVTVRIHGFEEGA